MARNQRDLPLDPSPLPALQTPANAGQTQALRIGVHNLLAQEVPENTRKAQDPKKDEYRNFCKELWPHDDNATVLTHEKVYRFMYYQAFREQKPRGGSKKEGEGKGEFNFEAYKKVMNVTDNTALTATVQELPQPEKPTTHSTFNAYKAVLRKIYKEQKTIKLESPT